MRILMLTDVYPPVVGGVEQHVRNLSRALARRGHQVTVATLRHNGSPADELDGEVRVLRLQGTTQRVTALFSQADRRYAPPLPDPEVVLALGRLVRRERPDIVHAHNWLVHSFLPLRGLTGARLVVTLHEYSLACPKKSLIYRAAACAGPGLVKCLGCGIDHYGLPKGLATVLASRLMGPVERLAVDMFLPVSQAVAAGSGLVGSRLPYRVVPNFVPDDIGQPSPAPPACLAQLPGEDYFLFVGALGRHKGVHVLLRAYAGLRDAPPLVLIGPRWPDTPADLPPNVTVLPSWPHAAVMEAWRRCLIALAPSTWPEPSGTVVLEAMAAGRPVIATAVGGLRDLVADGVSGLLVPPDDPEALRGAIARLLADPALRQAMGQAGRRRLAAFQASAVVPQVEQVYQEVARRPGRVAPAPGRDAARGER
jgi:glycosyltransferase involved in cell wall biosynthesis